MIIIVEKINGTIPSMKAFIEGRNDATIWELALMQTGAGADYLDICASTSPDIEV